MSIGKVILQNVRLSFPVLWTPKRMASDPSSKPRYSANFLIERGSPNAQACMAAIKAVALAAFKEQADAMVEAMKARDMLALHDGNTKPKYDGYAGMLFVSSAAPENQRPLVLNRNKSPLTEQDGVIYSGCYVDAGIEFWAQKPQPGRAARINCSLSLVRFRGDGEAFGGGSRVTADELPDLDDEDDGFGNAAPSAARASTDVSDLF